MSGLLLLLALAILVIAWLTAAATAVRSVSRLWLRHWVEEHLSGTLTAETYLERLHGLLIASAAGVALVLTLAGVAVGTSSATNPPQLAWRVVLFLLATLLLGQLIPRAIARHWAARLIPVLLPPLRLTAVVLRPLVGGASALGRALGPSAVGAGAEPQREGIEDLLREGQLEGIGEREEIQIIAGVVEFGEKTLRDVMTPRTQIFAIAVDMPPQEMAVAIAQSGYSRVPVYHDSLDEIIGIVHAFDVLQSRGETAPPIRPVAQAPASKRASEMLFEMLRAQRHLAVVLDEFGGTAGIVTLEDVIEELVGDIRDEHDEPAAPEPKGRARALVLDAATPMEEVAERFGVGLPDPVRERAPTVGGVLVRALGRIPTTGERFLVEGLEVTVIDATPARLGRLLVQRAEGAHATELPLPR